MSQTNQNNVPCRHCRKPMVMVDKIQICPKCREELGHKNVPINDVLRSKLTFPDKETEQTQLMIDLMQEIVPKNITELDDEALHQLESTLNWKGESIEKYFAKGMYNQNERRKGHAENAD